MEMPDLVDRNWDWGICSLRSHIPTSAGHHRTAQKRVLQVQDCFFYTHAATLESKLSSCRQGIKKAQPKRLRFCLFVIRLGFEPKTHSLEGCCSIQLSYRTSPSFVLKADAKIGKNFTLPKFICRKFRKILPLLHGFRLCFCPILHTVQEFWSLSQLS